MFQTEGVWDEQVRPGFVFAEHQNVPYTEGGDPAPIYTDFLTTTRVNKSQSTEVGRGIGIQPLGRKWLPHFFTNSFVSHCFFFM